MTRCGEGGGEARGSNPSIVFEFPNRHRRVCVWVNRQHPPSPPPIRRKAPGDHAQSTPESTNHNASLAVRGAGASRGRGVPNGGWPEQATDRHHPPHGLAVWNCEVEGPKFAVTVSPGMRRNESLLSYDAHMQTVLGDSFDYAAVKALPHLNMFLGWISTSEGVDALQVGSGGWARGGGGLHFLYHKWQLGFVCPHPPFVLGAPFLPRACLTSIRDRFVWLTAICVFGEVQG